MITKFYETTLNTSMIDKKTDERERVELKKLYNFYLDERKDIFKSTERLYHDLFGDNLR